MACAQSKLPVLTCTLQLREEFKQEVTATAGLLHVDDPNWPGIGVVRYVFVPLGRTETVGVSFCGPALHGHSVRIS